MRVTFLGTSHGVPAADRYCACAMLAINDALYFIDAGAPLIDLLLRRGEKLERIRALFTTHFHGDHINGILPFADLINWYFKDVRIQIYLTEERGIALFEEMIAATEGMPLDRDRVRFRLASAGPVYQDENLRVTALPTRHMAEQGRPSYAYLLEAEGKKLLFSGDLSSGLARKDFPAYALEHPVDLMVMEMAHLSVEDALPYLRRCRAKRLIIQHVSPQEKLSQIRALDGRFGYPVHAAEDGECLTL